jgi:hypothetical protein
MSADLLRRAAAKLREHVAALPTDWRDRPWTPVITDSESLTGVRTCDGPHDSYEVADDADPATIADWACDGCEHFETYSEGLAGYASMLHPPVALALAELLQVLSWFPSQADATDLTAAVAVARQVLREDGESA